MLMKVNTKKIINEFNRIKELGFVKNTKPNHGDGTAGNTFETYLGIKENNLRDPDSFKHRTTTITPGKTSAFFVLMTYGAKNGFGGYTTEFASARIDMNCNLIEAMNQKMETIR